MASLSLLLSYTRMRSSRFAKHQYAIVPDRWEMAYSSDIHPDVIYVWNYEQKFLNLFFLQGNI